MRQKNFKIKISQDKLFSILRTYFYALYIEWNENLNLRIKNYTKVLQSVDRIWLDRFRIVKCCINTTF
jgi:hypothetical protein